MGKTDAADIAWSPQQAAALDAVTAWHREAIARTGQQVFRVFGYAGTGKTTLARSFAQKIKGDTVYAAFTGKAALAMQRSGCRDASTIHSLIYQVEQDSAGTVRFRFDPDGPASKAALIVIDECSMVDEDMGRDLLAYGKPILVLGDPAQLPPVKSAGFFTNHDPDVMLTEIHRQAEGNPIIRMATAVREGHRLDYGEFGSSRVIRRGVLGDQEVLSASQILVGKNATRAAYNRRIRRMIGRAGDMPEVDDRLVCLKNDRSAGIFNGGIFKVTALLPKKSDALHVTFEVASEDFPNRPPFAVKARRECFSGGLEDVDWRDLRGTQQFDYGYALTCHKAQGSQWDDVIVYDESGTFRDDWRRWLYTAITRASDRITVVV